MMLLMVQYVPKNRWFLSELVEEVQAGPPKNPKIVRFLYCFQQYFCKTVTAPYGCEQEVTLINRR